MELQKQIEVKRKINNLFETGVNKIAVFKLIDEILIENGVNTQSDKLNVLIDGKSYETTMNSFESDLMVSERQGTGSYLIGKYFLKEVEND